MSDIHSSLTQAHLDKVRRFYDGAPAAKPRASLGYRALLAHYYNLFIPADARVLEVGCGSGELLARLNTRNVTGIDLSSVQIERARARVSHGHFHVQAGEELALEEKFDVIIVSDTLNYAADVQQLLEHLHAVSTPDTRLILNFHSNLWRPFFSLAGALHLRSPGPQNNWLSTADVKNLLSLADWEPVKTDHRLLLPLRLGGLEKIFNRLLSPLLPFFCLTVFVVARPRRSMGASPLTVSIVIPARNEAGNIQAAVERTAELGAGTELIFVEGHSRDDTWAEIQRVAAAFPHRRIKTLQQTGKGKGNAVRRRLRRRDRRHPHHSRRRPHHAARGTPQVLRHHRQQPEASSLPTACASFSPMEELRHAVSSICCANKTFGLAFSPGCSA